MLIKYLLKKDKYATFQSNLTSFNNSTYSSNQFTALFESSAYTCNK